VAEPVILTLPNSHGRAPSSQGPFGAAPGKAQSLGLDGQPIRYNQDRAGRLPVLNSSGYSQDARLGVNYEMTNSAFTAPTRSPYNGGKSLSPPPHWGRSYSRHQAQAPPPGLYRYMLYT
jgi:hypothetical protein